MKQILNTFAIFSLAFTLFQAPAFAQQGNEVTTPNVVAPAQPAAAANTNPATNAPATASPGQQQPGMFGMMTPLLILFALMYFMMIRPQQKRMKEQQSLLKTLQNGDEVITNSGIIGTITGMSEKVVTLEISKNVQMKILKSQVNQIIKGQIQELQQ